MGSSTSKSQNFRQRRHRDARLNSDRHLDKHTDESNSFVHIRPSKTNRIAMEIEKIENAISTSEMSGDDKVLALQKKKIEMLLTELELLRMDQRDKESYEKSLYSCYQKIVRREKKRGRVKSDNKTAPSKDEENLARLRDLEVSLEDCNSTELKRIEDELKKIVSDSKEVLKLKTVLLKKLHNRDLEEFIEDLDSHNLTKSKSLRDLAKVQNEWHSLSQNLGAEKSMQFTKMLSELEQSIKDDTRNHTLPKKKTKVEVHKRGIEYYLKEIGKISDRIDELSKDINNFKGTTPDLNYNFFMASLLDKKELIKGMDCHWTQIEAFKLDVLEKINYYENYLKYKLNQNVLEKTLWEKLSLVERKPKMEDLSRLREEAKHIDNIEVANAFKKKINELKTSVVKDLDGLEKELAQACEKINRFPLGEENFDSLDEELINLKIWVEKLATGDKKITLLNYVDELFKSLMDKHNGSVISEKSVVV